MRRLSIPSSIVLLTVGSILATVIILAAIFGSQAGQDQKHTLRCQDWRDSSVYLVPARCFEGFRSDR